MNKENFNIKHQKRPVENQKLKFLTSYQQLVKKFMLDNLTIKKQKENIDNTQNIKELSSQNKQKFSLKLCLTLHLTWELKENPINQLLLGNSLNNTTHLTIKYFKELFPKDIKCIPL